MQISIVKKISVLLIWICLLSCSNNDNKNVVDQSTNLTQTEKPTPEINNSLNYSTEEGVVGVFDVLPMLCLSKLDSAEMKDVANKVAADYQLLAKETELIAAEKDGPAGQINYNNDPNNFKFECLILIKKIPQKQPEKCEIVVLESGRMLIYNYYGPYQKLYTAYNTIRDFCTITQLSQNGPMREFYVSDPTIEKDSTKWLTRIMVPVTKAAVN